jgi:hypothetical protein
LINNFIVEEASRISFQKQEYKSDKPNLTLACLKEYSCSAQTQEMGQGGRSGPNQQDEDEVRFHSKFNLKL